MMGFAILILMIFHSSIPSFYGLKNILEIGVDIFFFLGGFTCTLSYCKSKSNNKIGLYFKKRAWRILPPYLILYTIIYVIEYLIKDDWNWIKFWGELTMWDNLVHNSINMWYVPAVLLMYILIPFYVNCYAKWKFILWLPFVVLLFVLGISLSGNIDILPFRMAWVRLPIFLLGVNLFLIKDRKYKLNKWVVLICAFIAFIICWILDYHQLITLKRLCYIPLVIATVYYYDKNRWCRKFLGWAGTFSYENYLMHWYVLHLLYDYTAEYVVSTILSLSCLSQLNTHRLGIEALYASVISYPLALVAAYLYHYFLNNTIYKGKKRICRYLNPMSKMGKTLEINQINKKL